MGSRVSDVQANAQCLWDDNVRPGADCRYPTPRSFNRTALQLEPRHAQVHSAQKTPRTPTPTLNQPYDKLALKQFEDLLASCALEEAESSVSQAFRIVEPSSARVSVVLYLVVSGSRT